VVTTASTTPPPPQTTTTAGPKNPHGPRRSLDATDQTTTTDTQPALSLWWDGVHFTRWTSFKSHLQSRGVEPNGFLGVHPAIVKMLAVSPLQWEHNRFFVRTSLAKWLGAHGSGYTVWARHHAGAAAKLAP
jgi:hypothetical protein